ncbi:hypothetical protein [Paenibacillus elgii]|uniref:hypothetical protein n=1 Tax=Paenibacillus elgii TaxID=189691 RepID=UPI000492DC34|nr:hypothetical protein [Paenibacillus elgii]
MFYLQNNFASCLTIVNNDQMVNKDVYELEDYLLTSYAFVPTFRFLLAHFAEMERLSCRACPRTLFAVLGPVIDLANVFLPCLALFVVISAVFDDGFDFVLLQVVITLFAAIAHISDDNDW